MSCISNMRKYIGRQPMLSAGATVVVIKDNKILLNLRSDTNTWGYSRRCNRAWRIIRGNGDKRIKGRN